MFLAVNQRLEGSDRDLGSTSERAPAVGEPRLHDGGGLAAHGAISRACVVMLPDEMAPRGGFILPET